MGGTSRMPAMAASSPKPHRVARDRKLRCASPVSSQHVIARKRACAVASGQSGCLHNACIVILQSIRMLATVLYNINKISQITRSTHRPGLRHCWKPPLGICFGPAGTQRCCSGETPGVFTHRTHVLCRKLVFKITSLCQSAHHLQDMAGSSQLLCTIVRE